MSPWGRKALGARAFRAVGSWVPQAISRWANARQAIKIPLTRIVGQCFLTSGAVIGKDDFYGRDSKESASPTGDLAGN